MAAHPLTIFFRTFLQKPAPLAGARALAPLGATATQSPSGDWARGTPGIPHQGPDPGQAQRKAHLTPPEDRVEGGGEQGPEAPEASWQRKGKQERGTWCLLLIREDGQAQAWIHQFWREVSQGYPRRGRGRSRSTVWITPPPTPAQQAFPSSSAPHRSSQGPICQLHRGPLSQNLTGPALLASRPSHMLSPAQARRSTPKAPAQF